MTLARKILSNTVAQIAGKAVVALIGFVTIKILTNYLDQTSFGQYTIAYEFLAIFAIAADLGLFTIAVKEMSEDKDKIAMIIGNVLSIRTILSVLVMALAVGAAFFIPQYQGTKIPLAVAIGSLSIILSILNGTLSAVLQVYLKMEIASLALVLGRLAGLLYLLYVIYVGYIDDKEAGFYQVMVAGLFTNGVMLVMTSYYVSKLTTVKYRFDYKLWKEVFWKALPYGLALILNTIYFRIDSVILSLMRNEKEVAVYGIAMKILEIFSVLPLYFMNSVLPTITRTLKEGKASYDRVIQYSFDFLNMISMPMVVGAFVLAYPVIYILSNHEYLSRLDEGFYGSDIALQILVFAMLFSFINVLFAFILIAVNKQVKLLYINAGMVVFNIVSNILIIPYLGFRGAAFTSVLTELIILILNARVAKKYVNYSINLKNFFKIMLSSLVMGVSTYEFVNYLASSLGAKVILVAVPFGGFVYVLMLFISKAVTRDMLKMLRK